MTRRISVSPKELVTALIKKELVESSGLKRKRVTSCARCDRLVAVSKRGRVAEFCKPCRTNAAAEKHIRTVLMSGKPTVLDRAPREHELVGPADFDLWMKWRDECRERERLLAK